MSSTTAINVQLQRPFALGHLNTTSRLAVWLLAAIAWRAGPPGGGQGLVSAQELAAQLGSATALPMALSRLFALLGPLDLELGWGADRRLPPAALPLRGRSRGPFWMTPSALARLRFCVGERQASGAELERFVGLAAEPAPMAGLAKAGAPGPTLSSDDLDRWYALLDARQRSEEASLRAAPSTTNALADLRLAPHERLARAWSLFFAARNARRTGEVAAARRALRALARELGGSTDPREQVALALARISLVWCDHQARRLTRAEAGLRQLDLEAQGPNGAVWRVNSRICCEFHNLRALVLRAQVVEGRVAASARPAVVRRVVADLREALICAVESDAFTLLESVAANLGYTLWLLEAWLPPDVARQGTRMEAVRWILLSEWLCQRHGLAAGSPWNLINVCRVARGAGAPRAGQAPMPALALAQVRDKVGAATASLFGPPARVRDWIDLSAALADNALAADTDYTPMQQVAALVEHAWQLTGAGRWAEFERCRASALALLPRLAASDRRFFRREIDGAGQGDPGV